MKKIGDVFERNGQKYVVTYVSGENFSYAPVQEEAKEEPVPEEAPEEEQKEAAPRKRGRKATA